MEKSREEIKELVLEQIKKDIEMQDLTAIEDLLENVSIEELIEYLPEGTIDADNK